MTRIMRTCWSECVDQFDQWQAFELNEVERISSQHRAVATALQVTVLSFIDKDLIRCVFCGGSYASTDVPY